ncbi:hypothetical protein BC833DRAFT_271822 [Globomyces pollinis-pini]|nr:hypothetical protein BC833DRAFT_271822 [Globomyces pollinis-pini]
MRPSKKLQTTANQKPKKPMNAFFVYRRAIKQSIIDIYKVNKSQEISKIAGQCWYMEPIEFQNLAFQQAAEKLKSDNAMNVADSPVQTRESTGSPISGTLSPLIPAPAASPMFSEAPSEIRSPQHSSVFQQLGATFYSEKMDDSLTTVSLGNASPQVFSPTPLNHQFNPPHLDYSPITMNDIIDPDYARNQSDIEMIPDLNLSNLDSTTKNVKVEDDTEITQQKTLTSIKSFESVDSDATLVEGPVSLPRRLSKTSTFNFQKRISRSQSLPGALSSQNKDSVVSKKTFVYNLPNSLSFEFEPSEDGSFNFDELLSSLINSEPPIF